LFNYPQHFKMHKYSNLSNYSAKEIHNLGRTSREKDAHLEALQYLDQSIIGYQKEKDYRGIIDALAERTITWKHFFLLTNDMVYAILAQKDAEAMLNISQEKKLKDKLSTSFFRLGEVAMLFKEHTKAINYYKKSLVYYSGILSQKGQFRYHLGEALYRNDEKKRGKKLMIKGLEEIKEGSKKAPAFFIHVWESGCRMQLADLLRKDEPEEAKKHLIEAEKIIKTDKKLIIRKRQFKELKKTFSF